VQIALALVLTIFSACALDYGYLMQSEVAAKVPPLSLRHPIESVKSLLEQKRWLVGGGVQVAGFGLYVVALALAPLALVQAAAAGGIGILAIMVSRITHVKLSRHERIGATVSVLGLALLAVSLLSARSAADKPSYALVAVWLGASAVAAVLCVTLLDKVIAKGVAWAIASGILFASGDISTKLAVSGEAKDAAFFVALIIFYVSGQALLQAAFQQTSALAAAGLSTLLTDALPIAAGTVLFHEHLPHGLLGVARITAFAAVVAGAVLLGARGKDTPAHSPVPAPAQA
jgi:hypothetical protein